MAEVPHRVGRIDIGIHFLIESTRNKKERLLKVAHGRTVHQSIAVTPNIGVTFDPSVQRAIES